MQQCKRTFSSVLTLVQNWYETSLTFFRAALSLSFSLCVALFYLHFSLEEFFLPTCDVFRKTVCFTTKISPDSGYQNEYGTAKFCCVPDSGGVPTQKAIPLPLMYANMNANLMPAPAYVRGPLPVAAHFEGFGILIVLIGN